jgi:hypothetical protein
MAKDTQWKKGEDGVWKRTINGVEERSSVDPNMKPETSQEQTQKAPAQDSERAGSRSS